MKKVIKVTPSIFERLKRGEIFSENEINFGLPSSLKNQKISENEIAVFKEWDTKNKEYTGREVKGKVVLDHETCDGVKWFKLEI